jgi:hypothetical protein
MATRHFHAASPGAIIRFIFRKCLDFGVEADQPGVESIDLIVKTALRSYVFQQLVLVGGFLIGNRGETIPHSKISRSSHFSQLTLRVWESIQPSANPGILQMRCNYFDRF